MESLNPVAGTCAAPKHLPSVKLASPSLASSSGWGEGSAEDKVPRDALDFFFFYPPLLLTKKPNNKNIKTLRRRKERDEIPSVSRKFPTQLLAGVPTSPEAWGRRGSLHTKGSTFEAFFF